MDKISPDNPGAASCSVTGATACANSRRPWGAMPGFLSWLVFAFTILMSAPPSAGQDSVQVVRPAAKSVHETAPVLVDGRILFSVRGVTAYPAKERAAGISAQIRSVADDEKISAGDIAAVELEDQTDIVAGGRRIMGVYDADAAVEEIPRQVLAKVYMERIAGAVGSYRQERTRSALLLKVAYSVGATALLAAFLFLIVRLFRWLETSVSVRFEARLKRSRIQVFRAVQGEQILHAVFGVMGMVRTLLMIAFILAWTQYIMTLYPWTRSFSKGIIDLLLDPITSIWVSILRTIPDLIFLAILILIVRYVLKLARLFFAAIHQGTISLKGFEREWGLPTYRIFRLLAIGFAAVVAYPYIPGSDSQAFKGISIFAGVVLSLGSTSVVANTLAGYGLIYRRVFRLGDRVQIGKDIGIVEQIRVQVTHLRSDKNEEIIVPNSVIMNSQVINYTKQAKNDGLILHSKVGIGYETPWRQVESMLLAAADRTHGLLKSPPPFVLQRSLDSFCIIYEINVYCNRTDNVLGLYDALHRNILDQFNEYDVQIMTPAYVYDPDRPKVVPKDKWFQRPASPPGEENPS